MADETPLERFKNRWAAFEFLRQEGVTVSRGKFYQDCGAGHILVFKDKTVSRASVLEYARKLEAALPIPNATTTSLAGVKAELEVEKLRLEVAKLDRAGRAQDREWMRAEDGWMAIAALLGTLRDEFSFRAWRLAPELVQLVRDYGDGPDLDARVFELIEEKLTGAAFNDLPAEIPEGTYFVESIGADDGHFETRPEPAKEGTA